MLEAVAVGGYPPWRNLVITPKATKTRIFRVLLSANKLRDRYEHIIRAEKGAERKRDDFGWKGSVNDLC